MEIVRFIEPDRFWRENAVGLAMRLSGTR